MRKTAEERGYKAPVLLDLSGDVTGHIYGVWGAPTSYFVIDRNGVVKYVKVQASGLDLLDPQEVLNAYKAAVK